MLTVRMSMDGRLLAGGGTGGGPFCGEREREREGRRENGESLDQLECLEQGKEEISSSSKKTPATAAEAKKDERKKEGRKK
jgi:hypothetical protein